ncbi:putative Transducin/WD40 repeat-like superfamily protein [Hibiscus syriacus]|uniref:Transducin/WD40 repeat-like superfamily protein n=1 Tax=Hibiscus syriacus TaxID=106335 RepID=A0A6A3AVZ3_HIBSY|nr:putative Transducin/WD40 repeat-like superfamily protein [Hibiscus syriacus]
MPHTQEPENLREYLTLFFKNEVKNERRLLNFVEKAIVEDIIPILVVAFHCQYAEGNEAVIDPLREKRIQRIHKALDSDVELVKLLLTESGITLDDATALHYAAAYCDPKVISEILGLRLADVNLRNYRGYTVLHLDAMSKEPSVIMSLLAKGAFASTLTLDGRSAVNICLRLTRLKDYHAKTEQGKETNKDRICIDVLERKEAKSNGRDVSAVASILALARLLFPSEAKLATDIAHAETTSELANGRSSKSFNGNSRQVDLNETPIMQRKRLLARMEALMKTVDMGRRYFPHCLEVLDKFMEDDLPDQYYLETSTRKSKRWREHASRSLKRTSRRHLTRTRLSLTATVCLHRCRHRL